MVKKGLHIIVFTFIITAATAQTIKVAEPVRFLALGDSYTIGQSVDPSENWPNQFVDRLAELEFEVEELKIIAQTGWRTDNLQNAINQQMPLEGYTLVSLLIGVNNQFQGGSINTYANEFEELLLQAIDLADGNPQHVFVLSIPDYAYTPYGGGDPEISAAIDQFNNVNRQITETLEVKYIDITPISRLGLKQPELVANDGLHPSGLMYTLWVDEIIKYVEDEVGLPENLAKEGVTMNTSGRELVLKSAQYRGKAIFYNLIGQPTEYFNIDGASESRVSLVHLPRGLYIIRIELENKSIITQKIYLN